MLATEEIKRLLAPYCASRRKVLLAYLFGSVAQGRASKLSEIGTVLLAATKRRF